MYEGIKGKAGLRLTWSPASSRQGSQAVPSPGLGAARWVLDVLVAGEPGTPWLCAQGRCSPPRSPPARSRGLLPCPLGGRVLFHLLGLLRFPQAFLFLVSSSSSLPTPSVSFACPGSPGHPSETPDPFLSPPSSQLLADPIPFPFPCPVAPPRSPRDGRGAFSSVPRGPCPVPSPGGSPTGGIAFQPRGEEGKGHRMLCWVSGMASPAGAVQQPAELTTASAACCYFWPSLSVALDAVLAPNGVKTAPGWAKSRAPGFGAVCSHPAARAGGCRGAAR